MESQLLEHPVDVAAAKLTALAPNTHICVCILFSLYTTEYTYVCASSEDCCVSIQLQVEVYTSCIERKEDAVCNIAHGKLKRKRESHHTSANVSRRQRLSIRSLV